MFPRRPVLPGRSFFLFGPRGTGKTTWLRESLPEARWYNLLLEREMLRLLRQRERALSGEPPPMPLQHFLDWERRIVRRGDREAPSGDGADRLRQLLVSSGAVDRENWVMRGWPEKVFDALAQDPFGPRIRDLGRAGEILLQILTHED